MLGACAAQAQSTSPAHAQAAADSRAPHAATGVERAFALAQAQGPLTLHAFLEQMPKGGDLHMHLAGAVYAETFLDEAARDGVCVNVKTLSLDEVEHGACSAGEVSGQAALEQNNHLRDALIDSFSMRGFVPTPGTTGHDQFFATFPRFDGLDPTHRGAWLDEVAARAARQNEQYLEIMDTPDLRAALTLAARLPWNGDLDGYRNALLAAGLRDSVTAAQAAFGAAETDRRQREHCGAADAQPACAVQIRFLFQVLREMPPQNVFAQVVFAFELAKADPEQVVGLNFVQPEDGYISMRDYRLHMHMLDWMHTLYPDVRIALHAGELAPGMVPPEGLTFHIRSAMEQGHAERIGHGVDVMYETDPQGLLKEMADRHVLVEINLTSNDVILGIKGGDHPLPEYLRAGVPVALSTDDEGVSRIDLTHEYTRAVETYHLSYPELKEMVRASIEHSFLSGQSLWVRVTPEKLGTPVTACRGQLGRETPSGACAEVVKASEKAQSEWELEKRFRTFEEAN